MRTTLNLPDELVAQAREVAVREGTTLTALLTDGLRSRIGQSGAGPAPRPLPVLAGGGGLQSWVDPTSNASLLDAADRDGDARP
ncbi:MAG: hypothetical protein QM679_09140 [Patulibacter sp.]